MFGFYKTFHQNILKITVSIKLMNKKVLNSFIYGQSFLQYAKNINFVAEMQLK